MILLRYVLNVLVDYVTRIPKRFFECTWPNILDPVNCLKFPNTLRDSRSMHLETSTKHFWWCSTKYERHFPLSANYLLADAECFRFSSGVVYAYSLYPTSTLHYPTHHFRTRVNHSWYCPELFPWLIRPIVSYGAVASSNGASTKIWKSRSWLHVAGSAFSRLNASDLSRSVQK